MQKSKIWHIETGKKSILSAYKRVINFKKVIFTISLTSEKWNTYKFYPSNENKVNRTRDGRNDANNQGSLFNVLFKTTLA